MATNDRHPTRRLPAVLPGAVLLLGLVTTLLLARGGERPADHPRTVASLLSATSPRGNRPPTERLVTRLLAEVRLPPGAHRRSSAPARELRGSGSTTDSSNLVDRHRWWTTSVSRRRVLAYVRHHPPQGCRFSGSGTSFGPHERTVYELMYTHRATSYAYEPDVIVNVVSTDSGSAVQAVAEAVWLPHRPASSFVRHPSAVRVVVQRHATFPGSRTLPTVRRTLGTRKARRLGAVLDRQTVVPPVEFACPADFPGVDDRLVFTTPRGPVPVTVALTGCGEIEVHAPHHHEIDLSGDSALDSAVRHELHLPHRYRP